jgi:hypothetical protein
MSFDIDFGTRWVDPGKSHWQRVSWEPATGELYVTETSGSYRRVLAVIPDRIDVERSLEGWEKVSAGAQPPLSWVEERVLPPPIVG